VRIVDVAFGREENGRMERMDSGYRRLEKYKRPSSVSKDVGYTEAHYQ